MGPTRSKHYRQLLLFLGTVLVPSALLVALAVRGHRQDRALAQQAQVESRRQLAWQIGQRVLLSLEGLRLRHSAAFTGGPGQADSLAVVVAPASGGTLSLWETPTGHAIAPELAATLREAEVAEFAGRAGTAVTLYQAARAQARDTLSLARIRLGLSRALGRAGRTQAARVEDEWLLALPFELRDEEGIPLALYAADRLRGSNPVAVAARVEERLRSRAPLDRLELYMLRDLVESLHAAGVPSALRPLVDSQLVRTEQFLALRRDLPTLLRLQAARGAATAPGNAWFPYGEPAWLIGTAPTPGGADTLLIVVELAALERALQPELTALAGGPVRLTLEQGAGSAEPLGPSLVGVTAVLPVAAARGGVPLLGPLLLLVLTVSALTAWLLWRDVRRESRAAALRSRFVSAVSHELKTPLTSIRMFAEMLRMHPGDGPDRQAFLDTIVGESERLTRLIENVLHFSRMEERSQSYRLSPASLHEIVAEAARAMEYPLGQEGYQLRISLDESLPPVRVDRDAILQAILNLLSNAMKFSPRGSEISLGLERLNGDARITVRDQGIGIDPSEQVRIFEEFYRSPASDAAGIEGTGLGLALVAAVSRAHGGGVEVVSTPGSGSTFTLRIPLATPE